MPRRQKTKRESRTAALTKKAVQTLVKTWNKWGAADGGWQKRVYEFGQRAQARIEFEEIALRSIDPALGPILGSSGEGAKMLSELGHSATPDTGTISLLYPSTFRNTVRDDPLAHLGNHLSHHGPKHYRRFWIYVGIIPLTAPFTLVPVIPNIPFFFVAWRAWSNYKAYKASNYLKSLIIARVIEKEPSPMLTEYYTAPPTSYPSPHAGRAPLGAANTLSLAPSQSKSINGKHKEAYGSTSTPPFSVSDLLLQEETIPELIEVLGLPNENGGELVNAVRQARARLGLLKEPKAAGGASATPVRRKQEEPVTNTEDRRKV